jgi:hypothetical protein
MNGMKLMGMALFVGLVSGIGCADPQVRLSYAPISSWFPHTPRRERASSLNSDQKHATSERLQQGDPGCILQLDSSSAESPSELRASYHREIQACQDLGHLAKSYHSQTFSHGGLKGTEIQFTQASGEHTWSRFMMLGSQLIVAEAEWTRASSSGTAETFMDSVHLANRL